MRIVVVFFILFSNILANINNFQIKGIILDKTTKEPLVSANIIIKGTYKGTISNSEGRFVLNLPELPAVIKISYIGYKNEEIEINRENVNKDLKILLKPVPIKLQDYIVTAEDPAIRIMKKVLEYKKKIFNHLTSYKALAYTRLVLKNDTSIALIKESVSDIFWDKKKGTKEVIKSERQTKNLRKDQDFFVGSSFISNFYQDDIDIMGFKVISPTHPDIFKFYKFKLLGTSYLDSVLVYKIQVIPKTKLQPVLKGTIWVLDSIFALIKVDLIPSENIIFPPPITNYNVHYIQQFNNYGGDFYLPIDYQEVGTIDIGIPGLNFPSIKYNLVSKITDYKIDFNIPDTLFRNKKQFIIKDTISIKKRVMFDTISFIVPLSKEEQDAYKTIDSTDNLVSKFKPSGPLAKLAKYSLMINGREMNSNNKNKSDKFKFRITPYVRLNRIEELYGQINLRFHYYNRLFLKYGLGYSSGLKNITYSFSGDLFFNKKRTVNLFFRYSKDIDVYDGNYNYSYFVNSIAMLISKIDYFDYFWNKKFSVGANIVKNIKYGIYLSYNHEEHSACKENIDYVFYKNIDFRGNPIIDRADYNILKFNVKIGEEYNKWGIASSNGLKIKFLTSLNNKKFTKVEGIASFHFSTYLKRRLFPPSISFLLRGGISKGDLPLEYMYMIDTRIGHFSPFGTLKTAGSRPLLCDQYMMLAVEHNMITVPFEILGLKFLARRNVGIVLNYTTLRTWLSNKNMNKYHLKGGDTYHEIGISLNNIFNFIRLDYFHSLSSNAYYYGISITRFF